MGKLFDSADEHERETIRQGVRLNVLARAIGALIVTHPDPRAFARQFRSATAQGQIVQISSPDADEALRRELREFSEEIEGLAEDVARRRSG